MNDSDLIVYYSRSIPVDEEMLAPLGLVTWAAIRLHSTIRDILTRDLGDGLSDKPFDMTLGRAMSALGRTASEAGEPWAAMIRDWYVKYGSPALDKRNSVTHAIAYTAEDGKQALMRPRRHGGTRLTVDDLHDAAGHLTLASVRLGEARDACITVTKESTS